MGGREGKTREGRGKVGEVRGREGTGTPHTCHGYGD